MKPSQLRTELIEHDGWRRTLSVSVPAAIVRAELDGALKQVAARLEVPGFRQGRAPIAAVQRQYGEPVRREALQRVIDRAYRAALAERAIQPVSEGELEKVDYEPDSGLTFRMSFDVRPLVHLPRLGGFRVERPAVRVGPGDLEEALRGLREEHAIWRPAEDGGPPLDGDLVTVRILRATGPGGPEVEPPPPEEVGLPWASRLRLRAGTEHRGRYQFVLGRGDALRELEEAIASLRPGETRDFALALAPGEGSAPQRLRITLEGRETRDLPDLDDAFARSLGDFDGLDELREKIRADLEQEAADRAEAVLRARLLDQILEANAFSVPASMVDKYLDSLSVEGGDASRGPGREPLRREAERAVKRLIVLDRIAELHGLQAAPAELDARIADIAARGGVPPERVRAQLIRTGKLDRLAADITNAKVFDFLMGRSEVLDENPEGS